MDLDSSINNAMLKNLKICFNGRRSHDLRGNQKEPSWLLN